MRKLIKEADRDVVEEVKWVKPSNPAGIPTWSHDGIICTGETYKAAVKLTFAKGASLEDPAELFNSSLGGNTRRAIDIHEGETVDARAFKALVRAAVDHNTATTKAKKPTKYGSGSADPDPGCSRGLGHDVLVLNGRSGLPEPIAVGAGLRLSVLGCDGTYAARSARAAGTSCRRRRRTSGSTPDPARCHGCSGTWPSPISTPW